MSTTVREETGDKRGTVVSPVLQYFGYFKSDKSQTDVICKLCKVVVPTKSGNLTNLFYHLSRSHWSTAASHSQAIAICRYRWNTTQAATDHHGEVLGSSAIRQKIKTL